MKTIGKIVGTIFGFVLLAGLGVGGYVTLKLIVERFARIDFQVATVTAIGSVVALLVAVVIASSIRLASKQKKADWLHSEKTATYQLFIDLWKDLLRQGHGLLDRSSIKLSEQLQTLDRLLILYGSPAVIQAHSALRVLERESATRGPNVRSQFAEALTQIRKDLGLETRSLTAEELERFVLASSDGISAATKVNAYPDLQPRVSLASNS